jgi:hypothetical protein
VDLPAKCPQRCSRRGSPLERSVRFVCKHRHAVANLKGELSDIIVRPRAGDCDTRKHDGDEREGRKRDLARALNATTRPRFGNVSMSRCARPRTAPRVAPSQDGPLRCSRRSVRDHPRHLSSSGRASAAITPIHPSSDVIVLDQPAFSCGGPTLFELGAEPLIVVH